MIGIPGVMLYFLCNHKKGLKTMKNNDVKEYYSGVVSGRYNSDYEKKRWSENSILKADFEMTRRSIKHALLNHSFDSCLEVGPGPGTWTKVLYDNNPKATYQLIDISEAMKDEFLKSFDKKTENITYDLSDFIVYNFTKEYDFFFSSRALEYFDNKQKFVDKVFLALSDGGCGCIISKNPMYSASKKEIRDFHAGQISATELKKILTSQGFKSVTCRPAIIRLPIISRWFGGLSNFLHMISMKLPLQIFPKRIIESYIITFKK